MALRRGFKTEAAALAKEVKSELGLGPLDCLNTHELARHLDIPVVPLSELAATQPGVRHFLSVEREAFSALTVFDGHRRMVVHNDSHFPTRQNSNLAHELAHGILLHEPTVALDNTTGCRDWNETDEEEADWLAGELLVTSEMALAVARGSIDISLAAGRFGVSEKMLRWRLNVTGATTRVKREQVARKAKKH